MFLHNLRKVYSSKSKDQMIFDNVSVDFSSHKSIALMGRSGSGKTTLLSILSGLDIQYQGDYYFHSQMLQKEKKYMCDFRHNNISIISQHLNLLDDRTIFENIAFPLKYTKIDKNEIKTRINNVLEMMNLQNITHEYPRNLSGGEKQRIVIARAIVMQTDYILADEPTSELDEQTEENILHIFKELQERGMRFIIATHSEKVANSCEVIYEIAHKKIKQMDV